MKALIVSIIAAATTVSAMLWFKTTEQPKTYYSTTMAVEMTPPEVKAQEHCVKCEYGAMLPDPETNKIRCTYCGKGK